MTLIGTKPVLRLQLPLHAGTQPKPVLLSMRRLGTNCQRNRTSAEVFAITETADHARTGMLVFPRVAGTDPMAPGTVQCHRVPLTRLQIALRASTDVLRR
jgi:hypothetical protein